MSFTITEGNSFAEDLRKIRAESGISQRKMAELLEIPFRTYQSWEEGTRKPTDYISRAVLNAAKSAQWLGEVMIKGDH